MQSTQDIEQKILIQSKELVDGYILFSFVGDSKMMGQLFSSDHTMKGKFSVSNIQFDEIWGNEDYSIFELGSDLRRWGILFTSEP